MAVYELPEVPRDESQEEPLDRTPFPLDERRSSRALLLG